MKPVQLGALGTGHLPPEQCSHKENPDVSARSDTAANVYYGLETPYCLHNLRTKRSRFNRDAVRKRRLYLRGPEADVRETVCASAVTFRRALGGPPAWLRCGGPEAERVTVWLQTHIRLASAADPICSRLTRESGFRREVRPQNTLSTGSLLAL